MLVVHFFSFIITTYLKKFLGIKSLKYKTVFSRMSELWPHISPILPKMPPPLILRVAQPVMDCPSPSSKPLGETLQMGQNHTQQQKILPISHTRKISLANSSFRVINQYKLHLKLYSLLFYHFYLFIFW